MFKNRAFLIRIVDKNKNPDTNETENGIPIDQTKLIRDATQSIVTIIGTYIAADTLRKVIIITTQAKIK